MPRERSGPGSPLSFREAPPLKKLGQNFLVDRGVVEAIVELSGVGPATAVVEIGGGRGALTDALSSRAVKVYCYEIDRKLAEDLSRRFAGTNVEVLHKDFLKEAASDLPFKGEREVFVVANIPYYITTPLVFRLLRDGLYRKVVVMVQLEVAERMVAAPGSVNNGVLGVTLQSVSDVEILLAVPRGCFRPVPKVDSAVVSITPKQDVDLDFTAFTSFCRTCFGQRRKTLLNNLATKYPKEKAVSVLMKAGIDPNVRPEKLGHGDFTRLYALFRDET